MANNLTCSLASMFLLLYYTDVAGIAAGRPGRCCSWCGCGRPSPASSPAGRSTGPPPGGAGSAPTSQLPQERAKLASARTLGAAAAIILLSVVVSPQITRSENLQRSLTITTLILAVVGIALYLFAFKTPRCRT